LAVQVQSSVDLGGNFDRPRSNEGLVRYVRQDAFSAGETESPAEKSWGVSCGLPQAIAS
jgi:hypothetical protein